MYYEVSIPLHPISKKILIALFGPEPIEIPPHSTVHDLLTGDRYRNTPGRRTDAYTATVTLLLSERYAKHVQAMAMHVAARLYRAHKEQMCFYANTVEREKGKGHAWRAVQDWLDMYGIGPDDYETDTAYKSYQRWGWEIKKKNESFLGHLRRKASVKLAQKEKPDEKAVKVALSHFMESYTSLFRRVPKNLYKQARCYIYMSVHGVSMRQTAADLGYSRNSVSSCIRTLRGRVARNPTMKRILLESIALPQATGAGASLGCVSESTRT